MSAKEKRKHRVMVEITFDEPCSDKMAKKHISDFIYYASYYTRPITTWRVLTFWRVVNGLYKTDSRWKGLT